jgi:hypothetical protein
MRPKISAADSCNDLDKFIDGLDNLPLHASATGIEMEPAPSSTSSSVAATSPGLDSFQSKDLHSRSQLGLCKPATDRQEANVSGFLSTQEKDVSGVMRTSQTLCRTMGQLNEVKHKIHQYKEPLHGVAQRNYRKR